MPEIADQIFDIEFNGQGESPSQSDNIFMESIEAEAIYLFERAEQYLMPVINQNCAEYSEKPNLNSIIVSPVGGKGYRVRVEMYFEKEEQLYWWVTFNVPYPFPPFPVGNERIYYPIELGRYVA